MATKLRKSALIRLIVYYEEQSTELFTHTFKLNSKSAIWKRRQGMMQDMFEPIYEIVAAIPVGFVMSYGDVARLAGVKNPRWVGRAMHMNSDPQHVPCHRVVHADGSLAPHYAFGGRDVQKEKLLREGVKFIGERVNMTTCRVSQNVM